MRGRQLRPSAIQDVCVFCTTRLQFAPTYKPITSQRVLFRSGRTSKESAQAAVAQEEAFESHSIPASSRNEPNRQNPPRATWGKWRPASTVEKNEQRWRIGGDRQKGSGQSFSARQQAAQQSSRSQPPPPPSHLTSTAREGALRQHAEAARSSQVNHRYWQCGCGLRNSHAETRCMRCQAPVPTASSTWEATNTDNPNIAQGWKHIRHIGEVQSSNLGQDLHFQRSRGPATESIQDQARLKRFEEAKGSRFVGLESKFKRPRFGDSQDSRKAPSKAPPDQRNLPSQYSFTPDIRTIETFNQENVAFSAPSRASERPQQGEVKDGWRIFSPPVAGSSDASRQPPSPQPMPAEERTKSWAKWTVQDTKADPEILIDERSNVSRNEEVPRSSSDGWRAWTPGESTIADQGYGPQHRDMSANERRAQNRMARRLHEIEEEQERKASRSKPSEPRFDTNRESRKSMMKTRRYIEERGKVDEYDDLDEDVVQRRQERRKQKKKQQATQKLQGPPTPIYLPEFISVANLAGVLRVKTEDFTSKMTALGFEETNNDHILDAETAGLIVSEFNFEPIVDESEIQDLIAQPPADDKSLLPQRPPVVTIMGHVDHGKTTLLDWLRKSSVAASEHGGITQHIGAFSVPMPSGRIITFLDTPGHAAFLDMRQRGANVTDIIILVVAADDSVKPQTVEAIKHAQAAKVPMIVAVNKVDKEDANVEKVKQDLARYGVEIEDYGGDTQVVYVSGKTGQGMETLEESAVALADILDIRAPAEGAAEGWVLEATTKKAGRVATVLVRRGTLRPSDIIVAGTTWARVRTLHNEAGISIGSAGPGTPVEIDGWKDQPAAGDEVLQASSEQQARSVIDIRLEAAERVQLASDTTAVNESRRLEQERREAAEAAAAATEAGEEPPPTPSEPKEAKETFKEVPLLVKADVSGSVEAVLTSILSLGNSSVRPMILRSGVGAISEFEISHAASAKAHIVCFNLAMEQHIRRMAESQGVQVVEQNIIYRLVDAVKGVLEEYLEPIRTKRVLGEAEVAQVFDINVRARITVPIAGCRVRNGVVAKNARVMVRRGVEVVFDGSLSSLKNRKQDATEMRKGMDCGMGFDGWKDFQVGDLVQSYEEKVEKRTL